MRRHPKWMLALLLLLLLAVGPCAMAAPADGWQRVELPEVGMSLLLPNEYDLFTRNMPEDSPVLARYGVTGEAITAFLTDRSRYLDAYLSGGAKEITISMVKSEFSGRNGWNEDQFNFYAALQYMKNRAEGVVVWKHDVYVDGPVPFVRLWGRVIDEPDHVAVQYWTEYKDQSICIMLHSYVGSLSPADEETILHVINSAVFQEATDTPAA